MTAGASWPGLKSIITELRNPTNGGSRFIRTFGLVVICGTVLYKYALPVYRERRFRHYEDVGNRLFDMERQKREESH